MKMKWSSYNLVISINKCHYIFNTLKQTLAEVDFGITSNLESINLKELSGDEISDLMSQGFIVPIEIDEYTEYIRLFENSKKEHKLTIKLLLSTSCNANCIYCYQKLTKYQNEIIDYKQIRIFLKWLSAEIYTNNIEECNIELFGGEPLLASKVIPDLYNSLNEISLNQNIIITTALITNATLFTDELIRLFIENNVELKITIDGLRDVHNSRRKLNIPDQNAYDTIISNIKKVLFLGRSDLIDVRMNLDKQNLNDVDLLALELFNIGVKRFYCGRVLFRGKKTNYDKYIINQNEFDREIDINLYNILKKYGFADTPSQLELKLSCQFQNKYGYVISPSLKLAKCDELLDIPEQQIGYIDNNGKLVHINDNYIKQTASSPADYEQCRNCKLLPLCGAGCPMVSLNTKGTVYTNNCCITEETIKDKLSNIFKAHNIC